MEKDTALLLIHAHESMLTHRGEAAEQCLRQAAGELARVTALARHYTLMPVFHLVMADGPFGELNDKQQHDLLEQLISVKNGFLISGRQSGTPPPSPFGSVAPVRGVDLSLS